MFLAFSYFSKGLVVLVSRYRHPALPNHQLGFLTSPLCLLPIFSKALPIFLQSLGVAVVLQSPLGWLGVLHGTRYCTWHMNIFLQTIAVLSPRKTLANTILYVGHWHCQPFLGACVYVNGLFSSLWRQASEGRHVTYAARYPSAIALYVVPCTEWSFHKV